jgi:hypothetical protein
MVDAFEQEDTTFETSPAINNLNVSKAASKGRDTCCTATKGFRDARPSNSGPSINTSHVRKKHEVEQAKVKEFFFHCYEIIDDEDEQIPIRGSTTTSSTSNRTNIGMNVTATATNKINTIAVIAAAVVAATASTATGLNATIAGNPPKELYNQLIPTMRNLQQVAPLHQQKIVVKSRKHEESINLAKPQMSMLKLMYACGNIDWEEGTVKNIHLVTFVQGFKILLDRLVTVKMTQLANLFTTVFTTKPNNDNNDTHLNPLNRLMSLPVFLQKNTKAHLNTSFQSVNLEVSLIYKSTSIHPFHYAPQTNHAMVKAASSKIEEERYKVNWRINDEDKRQTTSITKGVG